jgi:DNA polymerase-3 subunit gamma/tau
MSYQVLARKYRPKNFATLVGQEHVVRALSHALDQQRLHHAYLFTGTRGVGKTTLSRILAKSFNCEKGITSTPCGDCDTCVAIDAGRFVDYIEMDAASNRGVDEMAALLEQAVYAPSNARFKVYMIDEVHMLTNHAFNAMLKTLEEPPAHVKFILATTDPQKIPMTVLSRCLQFNLKQMPPGHIISHLENILGQEQIDFDIPALRLLAQGAHGSMRDALSLTDQAIAYAAGKVTLESVQSMLGALDQSYLIRLLDALADEDGKVMLDVADEMSARSLSYKAALQDLGTLLNQMAIAQLAPTALGEELPERAELLRLAEVFSKEEVQLFYQIVVHGRNEIGLAPDEYAGFTMTLLRMLAFRPSSVSEQMGLGSSGGHKPTQRSANLARPSPVAQMSTPVAKAIVHTTEQVSQVSLASQVSQVSQVSQIREAIIETAQPITKPAETVKPLSPAMAALAAARAGSNRAAQGHQSSSQPKLSSIPATPVASVTQITQNIAPVTIAQKPVEVPRVASSSTIVQSQVMPVHKKELVDNDDSNMPPPWDDADFASIAENAGNYQSTKQDDDADVAVTHFAKAVPLTPLVSPAEKTPVREAIVENLTENTIVSAATNTPEQAVKKIDKLYNLQTTLMPIKELNWDGHWPNLAASLIVRGVAQQLAQQSELKHCYVNGSAVIFKICVPVQTLLSSGSLEKLIAALNEQFADSTYEIRVETEIGAVEQTANAQALADKAERILQAEKHIQSDSFVQTLIRDFGASILTGSIKPI